MHDGESHARLSQLIACTEVMARSAGDEEEHSKCLINRTPCGTLDDLGMLFWTIWLVILNDLGGYSGRGTTDDLSEKCVQFLTMSTSGFPKIRARQK